MRPLRAAAVVMLIIAAVDGAVKLVEFLAGSSLWRLMLVTGLILLAADYVVGERFELVRDAGRLWGWLYRQGSRLTSWLLGALARTFRKTPPPVSDDASKRAS